MAAKKMQKIGLGELVKQVPKNQKEQFNKFRDISLAYQRRVNDLPETLPRIDWEYYEKNVRPGSVSLVKEFQEKYAEVKKVFDDRYKTLKLDKYFVEVDQQKAEVIKEVEEFKKNSEASIAKLQQEVQAVRSRVPYDIMTMEEFCLLVPDKSPYTPCAGRSTFWPFDEAEQKFGPAGHDKHSGDPGDKGDSHGDEDSSKEKKEAKSEIKKEIKSEVKTEGKAQKKQEPEKKNNDDQKK